jgi:hypothetical protein
MKHLFITASAFLISIAAIAQEASLLKLDVEARVDYMQEYQDHAKINDASGFKGRYLNIRMDGTLAENVSYSYRQRLNKPSKDATFFDATDWITLNYQSGNWTFSGGKQVVGIGGFEYDGAPIDLYFCSEYWNNIACYQYGASIAWDTDSRNDRLMFQFCESPFRRNVLNIENEEMFAYNVMWIGSHGIYSSLYSLNFIEYLPGRFINYLVLGNRFTSGDFRLDLDFMNRAVNLKDFGKDFSVMCELKWFPISCLDIFAKATHDRNIAEEEGDWCVTPGTAVTRIGGGIEFYPIKDSKALRLHLNCCYTYGKVAETAVLQNKQTIIDAGLTWKMNMLNLKRRP